MYAQILKSIVGLILVILTTVGSILADEETPQKESPEKKDLSLLTLERIYDSDDFSGKKFSARWLEDSSGYMRLEDSPETPGGRDIVFFDAETGKRRVLVPAARLTPPAGKPLKIDDYQWSKDRSLVLIYTNSQRVWRKNTRGDYWLLDRSSHEIRQLGKNAPPASLMFAKISPTGRHVAYVQENNLFVEDLQDHSVRQLTQTDTPGVINGTFDWVYEEELGLRDGFRWSPDGRKIAYWQIDTRGVREFPLVNNTAGLYPTIKMIPYPKVGQQNSACRVGVISLGSQQTHWVEIPGDSRNHYLARMQWAKNSEELLIQQLNRLQNTNRVMLANINEHQIKTILTEQDEAWVDVHDELNWFADGSRFTWISERRGWRHVYLVSRTGEQVSLATPGELDVIRLLTVDEKNDWLYFIASPHDPAQRFLYRAGIDGTQLTRITPQDRRGTHAYQISPDSRWAIHTWSSIDEPSQTELVSLPQHKTVRVLEENKKLRENVAKLNRHKTEFFRVDIGDEVELDAWCMKPTDFDADKKYPLLVYVYGEPAGQTVVDRWGGKSQLWHKMLAQQGYVVMSFDNRGTRAPRGRAWRRSVYRQVGVLAPKEQAAAVRAVLKSRPYLDPERVGVWGWSGGGSMTLNAIFKFPDLYRTGIAVAPVPNQRHYDTIYQERYMGLPGSNVDGFTEGSAINFAHQLKGNLLLIHGTGDDNCHYQTTEMLINELVRLNKPFSMMAYPNRTHSIQEGQNTTRHLRELMTRYLHQNLPVE